MEIRKFDKNTSQVESQMAIIDKKKKKVQIYFSRMRGYDINEMKKTSKQAEFKKIELIENLLNATPASQEASHPVFIAKK